MLQHSLIIHMHSSLLMAALDSVTAPLVIRFANNREKVIARAFGHPLGVIYLDTFWHLHSPNESVHLLRGPLTGDGPWRVGDNVIRILGCAHTDPQLQAEFVRWRDYLALRPADYPPEQQIRDIVARLIQQSEA